MKILRFKNFEEAFNLFTEEAAHIAALYGAVYRTEEKIVSLKHGGMIYFGKKAIASLSNGEDVEFLAEKQSRLEKVLWNQLVIFNKKYHQSTGRYLMNKVEAVDNSTYRRLYEELSMVI